MIGDRRFTLAEQEAALRTATYDELAVGLFVGKLSQLIGAGGDLGITSEQLYLQLSTINRLYDLLTEENDARAC